jgi:hypothetical protein
VLGAALWAEESGASDCEDAGAAEDCAALEDVAAPEDCAAPDVPVDPSVVDEHAARLTRAATSAMLRRTLLA